MSTRVVARWALPLAVILAFHVVAVPSSRAADAPGESESGAAPGSPTAQSAPADLGKSAEEVAAQLRHLTESLQDGAAFSALQAEVAADAERSAARWNETDSLLKAHLRPAALDSLASAWAALRNDVDDVSARIDVRVRGREADLATLTRLHASWAKSLELARAAGAPPAVLARAESTLAAIDAARPPIEQRRAQVLVLQDAASRSLETCDDALARIDDARRRALEQIVGRQRPPLWRWGRETDIERGAPPSAVATNVENLRIYARTYAARLALSAVAVLALLLVLRRLRQAGTKSPSGEDALPALPGALVRAPAAAAVLLGLLITLPLRPTPPSTFQQVMLLVVTGASVLIVRTILPARVMRAVYALSGLLVVNLANQLLVPPLDLQQPLIVLVMGAAPALLFWIARQLHALPGDDRRTRRVRDIAPTVLRLLAVGCGGAALAAVAGYVDLADFLGTGLLYAMFLAFGLVALRAVLDDLAVLALTRGPIARLHVVARHRGVIAPRLRTTLDVAGALLWLWFLLRYFELLQPIGAVAGAVLDTRLHVGALDLELAQVLGFVLVVVGIYLTTRIVVMVLEEDVYSRMTLPRGVPYALSTLTRYALLLIGFLVALATLGLDLTRITVLLSALGIGIGFGLQQIINNFVSGLILLFERPVQVGDSIEIGALAGDVLRIGIRSSTLRTSHGAEVIVPNAQMIDEKVTNWTLSDRHRRVDLDVTVTGDIDAAQVIALFGDIAGRDPRVSRVPAPEALLVRIGDGTADFQLHVWTDDPNWMRVRSDLAVAVQRALREARRTAAAPEAVT